MGAYNLKILYTTSSDALSQREQSYTKYVEADGYDIVGDGRVYEFWKGSRSEKEIVALYPTNCTIIESIRK